MLDTLIVSLKLSNTYRVNSIIYGLRNIPGFKRVLKNSLYGNKAIKIFADILSILGELLSMLFGKAFYLGLVILLPLTFIKTATPNSFTHVFLFLTLAGALSNTGLFNPSKDKYYAMFIMRMDAKKYTLTSYFYFLLKLFIGFLPYTVIYALVAEVSLLVAIAMPILVVSAKGIVSAFHLVNFNKKAVVKNQNLPSAVMGGYIILLAFLAYVPVILGYSLSTNIFLIITSIACALSIPAFRYIYLFKEYRIIYKELLVVDTLIDTGEKTLAKATQEGYQKKISIEASSDKEGYKYFNEIFMKRHQKFLLKSAIRTTIIMGALLIAAFIVIITIPKARTFINGAMLTYLPYFLFVMYFMNSGKGITHIMFMNCDHSMLSYRFYRQP
ncbi:MAG: hypothetical protein ACI33K_00460 [Clostridiaceae bacterium]